MNNARQTDTQPSHLKQRLKQLPKLPGVYKMLGKNGELLYVGKAKSLKQRVASYFQATTHPKTCALVARIHAIDVLLVQSDKEALLLEQTLIKQHQPPYNMMLKDDKAAAYVSLSADPFPRLFLGRGKQSAAGGQLFGPYPSAGKAQQVLQLVQKLFRLRTCSNRDFGARKSPCLNYQINRCSAPCVAMIDKKNYQNDVAYAQAFLQGDTAGVKRALQEQMHAAASHLHFEQAALYRDRLSLISQMETRQAICIAGGNADVLALASDFGVTCVHVLTVRHGQVLGGNSYFVDDVDRQASDGERLAAFVLSFYRDGTRLPAAEIIASHFLPDQCHVQAWLNDQCRSSDTKPTKITIKHNVHAHRKDWLAIAQLNANHALKNHLAATDELQQRFAALDSVLKKYNKQRIDRIECIDISHNQGEAAVASCVVYDRQGVVRRAYRHYAMTGIAAGDDYAAIAHTVKRRYKKHPLPDLLLIDGGKGQLKAAMDALAGLNLPQDAWQNTLLMAIAKGCGRKAGLEVLHFIGDDELDLPSDNKALHLLMYVRDEAHRFAITHHRKKLSKTRASSVLELIPGLGAVRRRALLGHFGGMSQLLGASQKDIAQVPGIGTVLAQTIYQALHG